MLDKEMLLAQCRLCPRNCGADRRNAVGFCGGGMDAVVAKVSLHPWEEPVIAGGVAFPGAGTVFFSGCSLRCVFCQNYAISHFRKGKEISDEGLGQIFLQQQASGAATLDLVTPTHYVPQIINGIFYAKKKGFSLPVVYNSSGYEKRETLDLLADYVNVFLPDLKYCDAEMAKDYSQAENYFTVATRAIEEMAVLAGKPVINERGIMERGVLVRHMVLPGGRKDSMKLLDWLWHTFGDDIYLSLMNQYTPMYRAAEFPRLKRRLTTFEYESVADYAVRLGFTKCFVQQRSSAGKAYVPDWTETGIS